MPSKLNIVVQLLFVTALIGLRLQAQSPLPDYVLAWSDDFSNATIDATRWNFRSDAKLGSAQLASNIAVNPSGFAALGHRAQSFAGKSHTGAGLVSKTAFRYGYFEVKAKVTSNTGWHDAFWLYAGDGTTTNNPAAFSEVDGFEINTVNPEVVLRGMEEWRNAVHIRSLRCADYTPGFSTAANYHTYGVEWTEQQVNFYLDGTTVCRVLYPASAHRHDLLNIWLTSLAYAAPISVAAEAPTSFTYVKYYVRDYYIGTGETGYAEYGGKWQTSGLTGFSMIPSRYSFGAAWAVWAPTVLAAGNYDVQIYKVVYSGSDSAAQVTVNYDGGNVTTGLNYTVGSSGWVDLGSYPFAVGSIGSVVVKSSGSGGCIRTNMVKFVRQ